MCEREKEVVVIKLAYLSSACEPSPSLLTYERDTSYSLLFGLPTTKKTVVQDEGNPFMLLFMKRMALWGRERENKMGLYKIFSCHLPFYHTRNGC